MGVCIQGGSASKGTGQRTPLSTMGYGQQVGGMHLTLMHSGYGSDCIVLVQRQD